MPAPLFNQQQTSIAANNGMAQAQQQVARAGRGAALPGMSLASPGFQAQAGVNAAGALGEGLDQAYQTRLSDAQANAQQMLAGQTGRAADWLSQLGNMSQFGGANQSFGQGAGNALAEAMGAMGGFQQGQWGNYLSDMAQNAQQSLAGQTGRASDWLEQMQNMGRFGHANQQFGQGSSDALANAIAAMNQFQGNQWGNYLQDATANANQILAGQGGRANDWLQQLGIWGQGNQANQGFGIGLNNQLLQAVSALGLFG